MSESGWWGSGEAVGGRGQSQAQSGHKRASEAAALAPGTVIGRLHVGGATISEFYSCYPRFQDVLSCAGGVVGCVCW